MGHVLSLKRSRTLPSQVAVCSESCPPKTHADMLTPGTHESDLIRFR